MEQYVGYIQLIVISLFCFYLILGSQVKKTVLTWLLFIGSVMLASALAYRIGHSDKPSAVAQIWFQVSNIFTYCALLLFEIRHSNYNSPLKR